MAEAAFFFGFDGIVAPSARWSCLNAVLFTARIASADLMLQDSEGALVDWDDWKHRNFDRRAAEALLRESRGGR